MISRSALRNSVSFSTEAPHAVSSRIGSSGTMGFSKAACATGRFPPRPKALSRPVFLEGIRHGLDIRQGRLLFFKLDFLQASVSETISRTSPSSLASSALCGGLLKKRFQVGVSNLLVFSSWPPSSLERSKVISSSMSPAAGFQVRLGYLVLADGLGGPGVSTSCPESDPTGPLCFSSSSDKRVSALKHRFRDRNRLDLTAFAGLTAGFSLVRSFRGSSFVLSSSLSPSTSSSNSITSSSPEASYDILEVK